jgi:hypothetical protein
MLTWTSANDTACTATGGWAGARPLTSTLMVKPTVTTSYTLTCLGAGGSIAKSVTDTVTATAPAPTLTFASLKTKFVVGDSAMLTWTSANDTACTATGGWAGARPLTSTLMVKPTVTTSYTLTCLGAGGSIAKSVTDTVTAAPPPPPPTDTTLPHQPAGLSTLVNEAWNQVTPSGWTGPCTGGCASRVAVTQDATAPRSPSNVLTFSYQGNIGGEGVGQIVKSWPGVKSLYLGLWFKYSTNWVGHSSGVNKMLYLGTNQGQGYQNDNILNFENNGSISFYQQNGIDDHRRMAINFTVAKGQWHFVELAATASTGGLLNGCLTIWVDGRQGLTRCDIRWKVGADAVFTGVDVDPIWGGGPESLTQTQFFWMDHLYLSGK